MLFCVLIFLLFNVDSSYYALLELLELAQVVQVTSKSGMSHDIVLCCIHLNVLQYLLFCAV